jgi:hypothetical protein
MENSIPFHSKRTNNKKERSREREMGDSRGLKMIRIRRRREGRKMGALDNMSDVFVRTFEQDGRDGWGGYDYLDLAAARAAAMSGANVLSGYGRHRQYEEEEDEDVLELCRRKDAAGAQLRSVASLRRPRDSS